MFAAPIVFDDVSTQERYEPFRANAASAVMLNGNCV